MGGPYEVMVGDLSDPLNYDPHLISVSELFNREEGFEFDFVRFDNGKLIVKNDDSRELSADLGELKAKIKSLA